MAKFKITKRTNGEFQFNLKATNGQVILTSEGYSSKAGCNNGIDSVKTNAQVMHVTKEKYPQTANPFLT